MTETNLLDELRIDRDQREADAPGRKRLWLLLILALAGLLAVGAWWWTSRVGEVTVETVTANAPQSLGSGAILQATGYVVARRMATVSAQIIGTLTEVLIEEGDHVDKGQVLARLEDSAQSARLHSAQASERAAAARVHQLEVQHAQAKRDYQRQQSLSERQLVSRQAVEEAKTRAASLLAQLQSARAQHKAATAQTAVAKVNFDYTLVRAPFAGVVTQKTAQVGEIIAPSAAGGGFTRTGVGTIVDMDSLEVEVDVNEAYIRRVEPEMRAEAILDAYPDWRIPAHVIAIVPTANRAKATVKVRVALESDDPRILPEMGVRVSFLGGDTQQDTALPEGVLVPATAVVERNGNKVVFVVEDGTAHAIVVQPVVWQQSDLRLVPKGVAVGAEVMIEPKADMSDGAAVVKAKSS